MKPALLLTLMLLACYPKKVGPPAAACVSPCGMLLESPDNGAISCATLAEAESTVLREADKRLCAADKRFCAPAFCESLFGWMIEADRAEQMITDLWVVETLPDGAQTHVSKRVAVVGLSTCKTKQMWLGSARNWRIGSFVHELLHVAQDCRGRAKNSEEDATNGSGHEGWEADGLYDFVEKFRKGEL